MRLTRQEERERLDDGGRLLIAKGSMLSGEGASRTQEDGRSSWFLDDEAGWTNDAGWTSGRRVSCLCCVCVGENLNKMRLR